MIALATALPVGAKSLDTQLIEVLGAAAGALATFGLLLLLPIYLTHRREVHRMLEWMDREPEAGTTEFRAVPGPGAGTPPPTRSGGKMTPAERVTSERPALTRIATGEYAAIEPERQGFWQRVVDRGPRHPLVLAIIALLIGVIAFVVGSQLIRTDEESGGGGGRTVDAGSVSVTVVNANGEPGTGSDVADLLKEKGFDVTGNTAAPDPVKDSGVFYAKGMRKEGKAVQRVLRLPTPTLFRAEQKAAADGADVVVVAGEDGEAGVSGSSGNGGKG